MPDALFAFPIVPKQEHADGSKRVALISVIGSRNLGHPASHWPNLGLEYAERRAQQLTGKSLPSRWQLLLAGGEPLAKHTADEHSGQLALYLSQVAADSNLHHLPYETVSPIWATGSIDDEGVRQDMNHEGCVAKIAHFLSEEKAHVLLAPAAVFTKSLKVAGMPRPVSLADFARQWTKSNYWDGREKVIVKLEVHELEACAQCLIPRGRGLRAPQRAQWAFISVVLVIFAVLTSSLLLRKKPMGLPINARELCKTSVDLLNYSSPETLVRARKRLAEISDADREIACYVETLRDGREDLPRAVFAARGLFERGEWIRFFPEIVNSIVSATSQRLGDFQKLAESYKQNPEADVGAKLLAGETALGVPEVLLKTARQIDEWMTWLPPIESRSPWKPPWLSDRTMTAELVRTVLKWQHISVCANFPGIPGDEAAQERPGSVTSLTIRKWIAALVGGVMVGGLQPASDDEEKNFRLALEHQADRRRLSLLERVKFIERGMNEATEIRKRSGINPPWRRAAGRQTTWPTSEELPLQFGQALDWCLSLQDLTPCRPRFEPGGLVDTCNRRGMGQADCLPADGEDWGICVYYNADYHTQW